MLRGMAGGPGLTLAADMSTSGKAKVGKLPENTAGGDGAYNTESVGVYNSKLSSWQIRSLSLVE